MNANNEIRDAMKKADWAEELDAARDQSFRQMMAGTFRGRNRWMAVVVYIYLLVFTGLMVASVIQFFGGETTAHQIAWATAFLFSSMVVMFLKLWIWNMMNRNAIVREIKRLELRLAEGSPKT